MSETNNNPIPIDIIEDGTEIQITVDNNLYQRLQAMIFHFFPIKDMDQFAEIIQKIKADKSHEDPLAYHLHTILWLCGEFEEKAKAQGKVVKKIYDPITKDLIKP